LEGGRARAADLVSVTTVKISNPVPRVAPLPVVTGMLDGEFASDDKEARQAQPVLFPSSSKRMD
jgi:hypothetical protein